MDINETIYTKLNFKDIALIAVALGEYQERCAKTGDPETLNRAANLVNRLGNEMANTEDNGEKTFTLTELKGHMENLAEGLIYGYDDYGRGPQWAGHAAEEEVKEFMEKNNLTNE